MPFAGAPGGHPGGKGRAEGHGLRLPAAKSEAREAAKVSQ